MKDTVDLLTTTIAGIDSSIAQQNNQIKFAQDQITALQTKKNAYAKDLETLKNQPQQA